jgi:hypothetical protein
MIAVFLFVAVLLVLGLGLLFYGLPRNARLPYVLVVIALSVAYLVYSHFASLRFEPDDVSSTVEIAPGSAATRRCSSSS